MTVPIDATSACHDAFESLDVSCCRGASAGSTAEMQDLIKEWQDYKRAAALLDFDDLLHTARDLLVGHEEVRTALARRYQHVLVDEFQDTDPLQIDILWQLCSDASKDTSRSR